MDFKSVYGAQSVDTLAGSEVTCLFVGAAISGDANADYLKIQNLSVNSVTATPEPGTLSTGLLALAGIGVATLRRRSRKA